MMTDRETIFSNNQAVTTGTQVSTNAYDTGLAAHPNINTGRELQVFVAVGTAFTGGTSLRVDIIESASSDLSSPTILKSTAVTVEASLTAAAVLIRESLPRTSKRYIGLQFVTVGTHSTGTIWGGLVRDIDDTAFPVFETGY